jgi:type II secretory pathway pseudopilin PulG
MRANKQRRFGFSLLEVLLSLFAVGVSMAAFIPASLSSRQIVAHTRRVELALRVGGAILDQQRLAGYSAIPIGSSAPSSPIVEPDLPNMATSMTVSYVDASLQPTATDAGRKKTDITVSWGDKLRDKGTVTLSTIIAND